jgi:SAM-dependent methyltransferase
MFLRLKRFLVSNKYFWKYRHFFQRNIFNNSWGLVPIRHFDKIFKTIKINSVLDFGCATSDKLIYFINRGAKHVYGIDINAQAIKTSETKVKNLNINSEFCTKISLKKINKFLKKIKIKKFDLVIIDRVFLILKDTEFNYVIDNLTRVSKYIYIDDFFLNISLKTKDITNRSNGGGHVGYVHKNFNMILSKYFFKPLFVSKSPYRRVLFANSRCALYKNLK